MENQQEIIEEKGSGVESAAALLNRYHHFPGYTRLPLLHPLPSSLQGIVSGFSALNPQPEEGSKPSALQETAPSLLEAPPSTSESPDNTRRHKKMEERIEEINQLCNQLLRELKESKDEESVIKGKCLNEAEEPTEKAVWCEKQGDFLIIHFRCPCKKCYALLVGENTCSYLLTSL